MDPPESLGSQSHPRSRRGGVRVVAKIRQIAGDFNEENPCSSISILRPDGDFPSIVFGDQASSRKDSYKMDGCYGQDEGTSEIYSREVKPLLERVFHGCNACVISFGTQGSGKSQMIQGSEEYPGLGPMAVSEILLSAEETGDSVSISCYEVCQDRLYDLLEPKEQEVLVFEDAGRRIQLKGLSLVPVKSISDFNRLYFHGPSQRKPPQKSVNDIVSKTHRGLIVYITCADKKSSNTLVGKMNFVDLAGYEDLKKNNNDRPQLAESAKVNKSLYALLNVASALNSDETYVPYRESKLTRLLQDFLCRGNGAVLITCLNSTLSQDTIHAVSLASRSCQSVNQQRHESAKCNKSAPKKFLPCSPINGGIRNSMRKLETSQLGPTERKENRTPSQLGPTERKENRTPSQLGPTERKENRTPSTSNRRPQQLRNSVQKPAFSLNRLIDKKSNHTPSMTKGRKLFNAASPITSSVQDIVSSIATTTMNVSEEDNLLLHSTIAEPPLLDEEACLSYTCNSVEPSVSNAINSFESSVSKDISPSKEYNYLEGNGPGIEADSELFADSPASTTMEETRKYLTNAYESSPDPVDTQTPKGPPHVRMYYNSTFENTSTNSTFENTSAPQDKFEAKSTGLKKSLVQECLAFLNSANKEELKKLKGIGEKRADYILQLREREPEPFKEINNLKELLGLSSKQIKEMFTKILGDFL